MTSPSSSLIYLDNHATTRCDPRVVEAMLPLLTEYYGNPHSVSHRAGREAAEQMGAAWSDLARRLGAAAEEIVITSGATEANSLAILGLCTHPRQRRRHVVTVASEHPSVLDPVARLEREGFRVTRLGVLPQGDPQAGRIDLDQLAEALSDDTALVSVMMANSEIGVLQPIAEIAALCHSRGVPLHTDATQALGRVPIDVGALDVDLLSASAHKFYGPKGIGLLYVRGQPRRVRLRPLIEGGGQQRGLRSGTLNPAAVVAMAAALRLCDEAAAEERPRIAGLRDRLWEALAAEVDAVQRNGPPLDPELRLGANLNVRFPQVEGEALMAACSDLAVSSGSACSSVDPRPSHVLLELGLSETEARSSLRLGVGRFNDAPQIERAAAMLGEAYRQLRPLVR